MTLRRVRRALLAFGSDEGGASAVEFALWLILLAIPTLNVVDMGFYIFKNMQVRQSAQAGAQAAESICGYNGFVPAATNCQSGTSTPALSTTQITIRDATHVAWNECHAVRRHRGLVLQRYQRAISSWRPAHRRPLGGDRRQPRPLSPPVAATTVTGDTDAPGDYVFVTASYNYTPMLPALSLLSVLRTSGHHHPDRLYEDQLTRGSVFARGEQGAGAAEFALLLPALMFLMFGTINLFLLVYSAVNLHSATEGAARYASVTTAGGGSPTQSTVNTYGTSHYVGPNIGAAFTYTAPTGSAGGCTSTTGYNVTGRGTYRMYYGFGFQSITLNSAACFP